MKKYASLLLVGIIFFCVSCNKSSQNESEYKIAVISPLSGPYKLLGESITHGAQLAVEEINKKNGINGKKVDLIIEDDGGLPGEGAFFAYRLTRTQMILGVIGHLNSDISIPASEFYVRAMVVQISPGSTSPYFTERESTRGYVFRTIGRDDTQGKLAADYVLKHGFKRVAVLYNDRAYGRELSGEFVKGLQSLPPSGIKPEIVYYNMIQVGLKDYGSLLAQLSSKSPDVVFLAGEHDDAGHLIKDFPKYGLEKTQFIGGDGIDHKEFIKIGGINTEGTIAISSAPIVDQTFIKRFYDRFGENPTGYAANSYDATNILLAAIGKVKDFDGTKVAKEVSSTKDFSGVTGKISFNVNGDLTSPGFVLSKVVNGEFKKLK